MKNSAMFSAEPVNTKQQHYLNVCKTVTIFGMIFIHVLEEMGSESVNTSPLSYAVYLLELFFGAILFMMSMGITVNYSSHQSADKLIRRGIQIFFYGFLMNFLDSLLGTLVFERGQGINWYNLLNTDILQFAGLSMIMLGLFKKRGARPEQIFLFAVIISAAAALLKGVLPYYGYVDPMLFRQNLLASLTGLFWYSSENVSAFPFFIWFIFPAAGYWFGYYLIRCRDCRRFWKAVTRYSLIAIAALSVIICFMGIESGVVSYKGYLGLGGLETAVCLEYCQNTWDSFRYIAIVLLLLSLVYRITVRLKADQSRALIAADQISSRLFIIYFIQWVIIGNVSYFGGNEWPFLLPCVLFTSAASVLLSFLIKKPHPRKKDAV